MTVSLLFFTNEMIIMASSSTAQDTVSMEIEVGLDTVRIHLEEKESQDTSKVSDEELEELIRRVFTGEGAIDRLYDELAYWFKQEYGD
jgi:hypothetical protein